MSNITCLDIELAIMQKFKFFQNIIVPNVNSLLEFETDVVVLYKTGYAYGFEIKTTLSDLRADFKKKQFTKANTPVNGKSGLEHYYGKFKHFAYVVPDGLAIKAIEMIPNHFGIYTATRYRFTETGRCFLTCIRKPKRLFSYKWSPDEMLKLAHLGAMRVYKYKRAKQEAIRTTTT